MNAPKSVLIDAALTNNFHNIVARYCDGKWGRLTELWNVPFEEVVEEAKRRGFECYLTSIPRGEGYWLTQNERGYETYYFERGIRSDVTQFSEIEPAFRHWLKNYLKMHLLNV